MWFMHNGALVHFLIHVRQHLNQVTAKEWTAQGRGWSVPRSSDSLDLNPMDFIFMRVFEIHIVYATSACDVQ
jgi:hypothetical protein